MCMCVCVCVCMNEHTCAHMHSCTYVSMCVHASKSAYVHLHSEICFEVSVTLNLFKKMCIDTLNNFSTVVTLSTFFSICSGLRSHRMRTKV